jgi:uncharacterized delta-60 repeat protein
MKYIITALLLFVSGLAHGQAGYLDKTFGDEGVVKVYAKEPGVYPFDIKVLPNGKIIHCGWMTNGTSRSSLYVMKHHADGTIDSAFGDSGCATYNVLDFARGRMLVYSDGRILVFGARYYQAHDYIKPTIVRFLANGNVDTSFGSGGEYDGSGFTSGSLFSRLHVTDDGSIVALGARSRPDSSYSEQDPMITRITTEGKNDSSFGIGGTLVVHVDQLTDFVYDALFYPDGKYVFSYSAYVDLKPHLYIVRTDLNGAKDSSFGSNGIASMQLSDVKTSVTYFAENSGEKMLCVLQRHVSDPPKSSLIQLMPDGRIDESFGSWGFAQNIDSVDNKYFPYCSLDSNNTIIVTGVRSNGSLPTGSFIARYNRDGVVDSSFGVNGVSKGILGPVSMIGAAVQSDGKYLALGHHLGNAAANYIALYRFNNTGSASVGRNASSSSTLSLHPTPSHDNSTVTYTLNASGNCIMTLRDESGREVRTFLANEYRTAGEHKEELDLRGLVSGVYFLQIEAGGAIQTAKLIKQ